MTKIEYLTNKDGFASLITEKLGRLPLDFSEAMRKVEKSQKTTQSLSAAGVMLLLHFKETSDSTTTKSGEFHFLLVKRSAKVAQPGDLSCPGGMLSKTLDNFLKYLIISGILPVFNGEAKHLAKNRDNDTFNLITLFLANALRETWEETNIFPSKISFLGPLPTYSLLFFKRMIFPLVGLVKNEKQSWRFHSNREVEKIVEIPVRMFFNPDNYGNFTYELPSSSHDIRIKSGEFPCLIFNDDKGEQEILWGATFFIIMNLLHAVFGLNIPQLNNKRMISKLLQPEYMIRK